MTTARVLITPPVGEPVTLTDAKAQCRVDGDVEDDYLDGLIQAAREKAESRTNRALLTQTWELVLDEWPAGNTLDLPLPPLQSVTSITYKTAAGVTLTLAANQYLVATASEPGRVRLAAGASWPGAELYPLEAIRVRFVCGWASADLVPKTIRLAMQLMIGHWFENREEYQVGSGVAGLQIPLGVASLLRDHIDRTF